MNNTTNYWQIGKYLYLFVFFIKSKFVYAKHNDIMKTYLNHAHIKENQSFSLL